MKKKKNKLEPAKNGRHIRIRVAGILLNKRNELLLVNHKKNGKSYWLLPGGGVEYGEDLFTALKREFEEEVSLNVLKMGPPVMMHDTIYPDGSRHILNIYFTIKVKDPDKFILKPDVVLSGAAYVSIKDFKKILFYPDMKSDIIRLWKTRFKRTLGYIKPEWKD
jgi:ADP-ribose pyrophosphatase YjhB (NUDIX family)